MASRLFSSGSPATRDKSVAIYAALIGLNVRDLHDSPEIVHQTLMCLLKTHEDKSRVTREVTERLLGKVA